ncbi:ARM repeat-containing protein [Nemania abortiva]|nr:ARM repeat-containing protein [Nemania abortiva]
MFSNGSHQPPRQMNGVKLNQVSPSPESDTNTDIDIIAIHGLDTNSTSTWTWKHRDSEKPDVNWLKDPNMLPQRIPTARIFTCDWPASLFKDKDTIELTAKELARSLLLGIQLRSSTSPTRPIIFIASCLGGIILLQALDVAAEPGSGYSTLWEATRGIIFLATPFRGTGFQDVATIAISSLKLSASLTSETVTTLLDSVQESTPYLEDLVGSFTRIHRRRDRSCELAIFYETKENNPVRKLFPHRVADYLKEPKVLVESGSARLDIVPNPIPLPRNHVTMNKFSGPEDPGYDAVSGQINIMACKIRETEPIDKAYAWIVDKRYSPNLGIERLSGELLPMKRCYVNLAIVEQPKNKAKGLTDKDEIKGASPFSLLARLKVETPQKEKEIMLPTLFEPREALKGQRPGRILIRGRAGIGKTTICKKIVHEFTSGKWWRDLFDYVLWVPLRNLKLEERRTIPGYNLKHLFHHEYFSQNRDGDKLAEALWDALMNTRRGKALFILDGFDEVSRDLNGDMSGFLKELLNQPNVIITSRPNASLPSTVDPLHLELETIGFYPNQVDEYIKNAFTSSVTHIPDLPTIRNVQSFLRRHQLVQSLVRIPIQLDAFCYTWDDSGNKDVPQTMVSIYQNIEHRLWKKDLVNLKGQNPYQIQDANEEVIRGLVEDEGRILELIAFSGMYGDIIEFERKHRAEVSRCLKGLKIERALIEDMFGRVSFLRSSDLSPESADRNYHFLHLTFQEYFGAKYFVRQWKMGKSLEFPVFRAGRETKIDPTEFLRRNKYNPRYDIFWRFAAGLLDAEEKAPLFFETIEAEPRDLLGSVHQRLIVHCLSEVSTAMPSRVTLENRLLEWILFECKFATQQPQVTREIEIPVRVIEKALRFSSQIRDQVLWSLSKNKNLPSQFVELIAGYIQDEDYSVRTAVLLAIGRQGIEEDRLQAIIACLKDAHAFVRGVAADVLKYQPLKNHHLQAITDCLKSQDNDDKSSIMEMLEKQLVTEENHLQAIADCLKNEDSKVKSAAMAALKGKPVTENHLQDIVACLGDKSSSVKLAALEALEGQPVAENHLQAIVACLKDKSLNIRAAAVNALNGKPMTENHLQDVAACLEDKYRLVRRAAIGTLKGQPSLPEDILKAIEVTELEMGNGQPALPEDTLSAITARLENENVGARESALRILDTQPTLPEGALRGIAARLGDDDSHVREAALQTLKSRPTLPEGVLQAITAHLESESSSARVSALGALEGQSILSGGSLQGILARLKDKNYDVREAALKTLGGQPTLSEEILQSIAACLKDSSGGVREAALETLGGQPTLSKEILQGIVACLRDKHRNVREAAVDAIITQPLCLSLIPNQHAEFFYETLLRRSLTLHIVWQVVGKTSRITLGSEEYSEGWPNRLASAVRNAQRELRVPSRLVTRLHLTPGSAIRLVKARLRPKLLSKDALRS